MNDNEFSFPFDSVLDEEGYGDRVYHSEDFTRYFANFISNGVYPNPSTGLKVNALNGLVLQVKAGSGFINGYGYVLVEDMEISLNTANANYSRKDIVVLRLDLINRYISVFVKEGEAKANVLAPEIERNSDIYELQLAEVTVKAGASEITQSQILDTRLNSDVCGVVSSVVDSVDTAEIFNQYDVYLQEKIEEWEKIKAQQTQDWQNQTNSQQQIWSEKVGEIESWYNSVKLDITKLQVFDFDNLEAMPGVEKTTTFSSNIIRETLSNTSTGAYLYRRRTDFNSDGSITTFYYDNYDVETSMFYWSTKITTVFNSNGSITEKITPRDTASVTARSYTKNEYDEWEEL